MERRLNNMLNRLNQWRGMLESDDWLSRLLDLVPVSGRVEHRCFFGAPWQLGLERSAPGQIPYHIILAGSATLDDPEGGPRRRLKAGDILLLPQGSAHRLHDGSGMTPAPARQRHGPTITIDENEGMGERLDMLCGRFEVAPAHERLLRSYFPKQVVVSAAEGSAAAARAGTKAQLASLVGLMRVESAEENLGGHAMLNGLSAALFTLTLRLASEASDAPTGLLALAANPRLAPALGALFNRPEKRWTLPALAALTSMSRATFIRQFQQRLGRSAIDLLTDVRMTLAANALRDPSLSTGAVADRVGYQSEAAFQRAFKQFTGMTPARYRREAQSLAEAR
jgi:AraC family transcriptional activator of mtrCDE